MSPVPSRLSRPRAPGQRRAARRRRSDPARAVQRVSGISAPRRARVLHPEPPQCPDPRGPRHNRRHRERVCRRTSGQRETLGLKEASTTGRVVSGIFPLRKTPTLEALASRRSMGPARSQTRALPLNRHRLRERWNGGSGIPQVRLPLCAVEDATVAPPPRESTSDRASEHREPHCTRC